MVSYSAPVGGFVFPLAFLLGLALLPFFEREDLGVGRWLGAGSEPSPNGRDAILLSAGLGAVALGLLEAGYLHASPNATPLARDLFNPATAMLVFSLVAFLATGSLTRSTKVAFLSGLAVLVVAVVGFTAVGLCRGPNWVFYWPWEAWPLGY